MDCAASLVVSGVRSEKDKDFPTRNEKALDRFTIFIDSSVDNH